MEKVDFLRKLYPVGCKVELHFMDDPQAPPSGTKGDVMFIDDIGQIHVKWETGSTLALNVKLDSFSRI